MSAKDASQKLQETIAHYNQHIFEKEEHITKLEHVLRQQVQTMITLKQKKRTQENALARIRAESTQKTLAIARNALRTLYAQRGNLDQQLQNLEHIDVFIMSVKATRSAVRSMQGQLRGKMSPTEIDKLLANMDEACDDMNELSDRLTEGTHSAAPIIDDTELQDELSQIEAEIENELSSAIPEFPEVPTTQLQNDYITQLQNVMAPSHA